MPPITTPVLLPWFEGRDLGTVAVRLVAAGDGGLGDGTGAAVTELEGSAGEEDEVATELED